MGIRGVWVGEKRSFSLSRDARRAGGAEKEREFFTKIRSAPVTRKLVCQKACETLAARPSARANTRLRFLHPRAGII